MSTSVPPTTTPDDASLATAIRTAVTALHEAIDAATDAKLTVAMSVYSRGGSANRQALIIDIARRL